MHFPIVRWISICTLGNGTWSQWRMGQFDLQEWSTASFSFTLSNEFRLNTTNSEQHVDKLRWCRCVETEGGIEIYRLPSTHAYLPHTVSASQAAGRWWDAVDVCSWVARLHCFFNLSFFLSHYSLTAKMEKKREMVYLYEARSQQSISACCCCCCLLICALEGLP